MFTVILKRSGQKQIFQPKKITEAIFKAAKAVGGDDITKSEQLTDQVVDIARITFGDRTPGVEDRITSYNVCYTKLLRMSLSKTVSPAGRPALAACRHTALR